MSMLEIQHLSTDFETENGMVHAVRDVSLSGIRERFWES